VDPGWTNGAINISVALGLAGLAVWIVRSSGLSRRVRWTLAVAPVVLLAAYYLQALPVEAVLNGDVGIVGWRWRWAEPDRSLAVPRTAHSVSLNWVETPHDYPAFLGGGPWAEVHGVQLETDWDQHPPRLLWKQDIGAGWSGFAVVGDYAVTQEQRGEHELVVCYEIRTGKVAWTHADAVRWDPRGPGALGDVGPRATPTIFNGKVFTHGATGILNCIDARSGSLLWTHDTLAEHDAENVMWGKAGSPLVVDDRVIVSVGGHHEASLVAYDSDSGDQVWAASSRRSAYATPVLTELAGLRQILTVNEGFLTAHDAEDGDVLWEHAWPSDSGSDAAAAQPMPVGDDCVLLTKGYGQGGELVKVSRRSDKWAAHRVWKNSAVLKNKMSNVLIRDGFAYGMNDVFLQCVELKSGRSRWKKRRSPSFGHGQTILVGDVILMLSESGELILIEATPRKYRELASMPALDGVTWNNPALAGPLLLVRNATQAACFELRLRDTASTDGRTDSEFGG
jgi:outer membrane protein assembly factor BamB